MSLVPSPSHPRRGGRLTPVFAVAALVAALSLGQSLRAHLGLDFSSDAIRT